jgi:hypothetical protein|tara:strand:+ start:39618 stop:39902 length:285 start_codon:yes stop_codon:yes gene_type:complete
MKFNPVNRHVWVEVQDEQDNVEPGDILLPEEYTQRRSPFMTCKVLKSARDCNLMLLEGDLIVVDASMISELKSRKNTFSVILENYIYGVLIDMA